MCVFVIDFVPRIGSFSLYFASNGGVYCSSGLFTVALDNALNSGHVLSLERMDFQFSVLWGIHFTLY